MSPMELVVLENILTDTEIATQLGLPSGTVKGRMRLGRRKLRASAEQAAA